MLVTGHPNTWRCEILTIRVLGGYLCRGVLAWNLSRGQSQAATGTRVVSKASSLTHPVVEAGCPRAQGHGAPPRGLGFLAAWRLGSKRTRWKGGTEILMIQPRKSQNIIFCALLVEVASRVHSEQETEQSESLGGRKVKSSLSQCPRESCDRRCPLRVKTQGQLCI